jgi:hypothetical protein
VGTGFRFLLSEIGMRKGLSCSDALARVQLQQTVKEVEAHGGYQGEDILKRPGRLDSELQVVWKLLHSVPRFVL